MFTTTVSSLKRKLFIIALCASFGCVAVPASAAVEQVVENGILMGANNLDVNGKKYDVRFIDGTFDSLFPVLPLEFTRSEEAVAASFALLSNLFGYEQLHSFYGAPKLINGCQSSSNYCGILTPYAISDTNQGNVAFSGLSVWDKWASQPTYVGSLAEIKRNISRGEGSEYNIITWAVWSPIPEPSTYAMLGLGLLGVMEMRRRQQKG